MDGVFRKQGFTKVYNIIGLISGIFLILLFGFFICAGEFDTLDDQIVSWFFFCFGLFVSILCGVSLQVNRIARIHVDEHGITAFCHFGRSLECSYSDIDSVSYGGQGLNIQLNNGRKYCLMNLENVYQIGNYIQRRISRKPVVFQNKNELIAAILSLRKKRKYEGIFSICCFLLHFAGIFLTGALTGWKELQDFTATDWKLFAVMACCGVLMVAAACLLLRSYLLHTDKLHKLQGALHQTLLQTSPLGPGNARKLFLDDEYNPTIRLTVYGYPNSSDVYFTVEHVTPNYEIACIHESKIYSSMEELAPEIEGMAEIALP